MAAQVDNNNAKTSAPAVGDQTQSDTNPAAKEFSKDNSIREELKPINLLPDEFKPKKSVIHLSKKLNKIAIVSLAVFLVLAVTSGAAVLLLRNRTNAAKQEAEDLTSQVSALEQTEQRLILVKDRINKINAIRSGEHSYYDTVLVFKDFFDNVPSEMEVVSAAISSREINTTVVFENSSDLARFLAQTVSAEKYSLVRINSLGMNRNGNLSMSISLAAI